MLFSPSNCDWNALLRGRRIQKRLQMLLYVKVIIGFLHKPHSKNRKEFFSNSKFNIQMRQLRSKFSHNREGKKISFPFLEIISMAPESLLNKIKLEFFWLKWYYVIFSIGIEWTSLRKNLSKVFARLHNAKKNKRKKENREIIQFEKSWKR